jgi:hypothetical protein
VDFCVWSWVWDSLKGSGLVAFIPSFCFPPSVVVSSFIGRAFGGDPGAPTYAWGCPLWCVPSGIHPAREWINPLTGLKNTVKQGYLKLTQKHPKTTKKSAGL